jgi:hypothetical protein
MPKELRVDTLSPGNVFREWLIDVLNDRIRNKRCDVAVYKLGPASHTVCRYEFLGEDYSVVAKYYSEQPDGKGITIPPEQWTENSRSSRNWRGSSMSPEPSPQERTFTVSW